MLYVEELRDSDATTWDRLLLHSPGGGHVYQTYAWGQFKATQGWQPLRLALKEDGRVLGVGQVLVRKTRGTTGAVAYCPRGPWIDWSNAEQARVMLHGMEHFARRRGAFILKVESELTAGPGQPATIPSSVDEPLHRAITAARRLRHPRTTSGDGRGPTPATTEDDDKRVAEARAALLAVREAQARDGNVAGRTAFTDLGFVKSRWDMQFRTTMVVDLDRSPQEMLARMKSKWRYNINLARRKGVTVEHDNSPAARHRLYEMYVHTALRDGFVMRPEAYFKGFVDAMIEAGHAHLFLACYDGRPLSALLAFTFGQKVWYQVGASETEGRNLMPTFALQFHVMEWAWQHGKSYYDLVAIPNVETLSATDSMWGLYVFKSGFGGRPVEWAGCLDRILDPRGRAWEALEPLYYRLYRWRARDVFY